MNANTPSTPPPPTSSTFACTNCGLIFDPAGEHPHRKIYAQGPRGPVCSVTCLVVEQTREAHARNRAQGQEAAQGSPVTVTHTNEQEAAQGSPATRTALVSKTNEQEAAQGSPATVLQTAQGQEAAQGSPATSDPLPRQEAAQGSPATKAQHGERMTGVEFAERARAAARDLTLTEAQEMVQRWHGRWPELNALYFRLAAEHVYEDRSRSALHAKAQHIAEKAREMAEDALQVRDEHAARITSLCNQVEERQACVEVLLSAIGEIIPNARATGTALEHAESIARQLREHHVSVEASVVKAMRASYDVRIEALKKQHAADISTLRAQCQIDLATQHENDVGQLRAAYIDGSRDMVDAARRAGAAEAREAVLREALTNARAFTVPGVGRGPGNSQWAEMDEGVSRALATDGSEVLERVRALEAENAALKAEVERLREKYADGAGTGSIDDLRALVMRPETDTLLRCVSEGGEVFVLDAESQLRPLFLSQPSQDGEVERLRADIDAARALLGDVLDECKEPGNDIHAEPWIPSDLGRRIRAFLDGKALAATEADLTRVVAKAQDDLTGADIVANEKARSIYADMEKQRDDARAERDHAYSDRARVVAALAYIVDNYEVGRCAAWRGFDEQGEPGFQTVCFIKLPTGQVSWHFANADAHLLNGLRGPGTSRASKWDGHTSEERDQRLTALCRTPRSE